MKLAELQKRRQRIAKALLDGADPYRICRDERISWSTVYAIARVAGVQTFHRTRAPLPPLKREFHAVTIARAFDVLAQLRPGDKSLRQIAVVVGVRRQWVGQIETLAIKKGLLSPREDVKCTDTTKS
ncbi:hypothetical protein LCGC14_2766170 [marine sediment metagenome]|uniref:Uncharacterized protein n=1 Tax=marine sediment metagenome TaxID=412755 RepID=A0A0F8ZJC1_9ZZZZ